MLPVHSSGINLEIKKCLSTILRVFYKPLDVCFTWVKDYNKDRKLLAIANEFSKQMTQLEMTPIRQCHLNDMLSKVKNLIGELKSSKHVEVKKVYDLLQRQVLAQENRNCKVHITDESHLAAILTHARNWKNRKLYFLNKELSSVDMKKMQEACKYKGFAELLLSDARCRDEFFRWTILTDSKVNPFKPNDVEIFVKFPGLHHQILDRLGYRIAKFGGELFQIDQHDQVLTVPLEGNRVKVLHSSTFEVQGHQKIGKMKVSFQDIFRELNHKISYDGEGEFEITDREGGIWLWNAKKLGYYHQDFKQHVKIDLQREDWILQLPTEETLTYEEAELRYKKKMEVKPNEVDAELDQQHYPGLPDGMHPIYHLAGTQKKKFDVLGTHVFSKFLLVNRQTKTVAVKSLGQFLYPFPFTKWEVFWSMTKFHPSYMYSPDENIFNANRQHSGDYQISPVIIRPSPTEWQAFSRLLRKDILLGWKGKLKFNFIVYQCATNIWLKARQTFGVGRVPDLRIKFERIKPQGALKPLYSFLCLLPEKVTKFVLFLMGSWRWMHTINKHGEEETISLLNVKHPFRWVIHPAGLFELIDQKLIPN